MTNAALHRYRVTTRPPQIEAVDVEQHAAMGALPQWIVKAHSAASAVASARHLSGHAHVVNVERIDLPAASAHKAPAAMKVQARGVEA